MDELTRVKNKLKKAGCFIISDRNGPHERWFSPITNREFSVSRGKGRLKIATRRTIEKQSGVNLH